MRKAILILLLTALGVIAVIALALMAPRIENWHRETINTRMKALAARVKANPPDAEALKSLIRALRSRDEFESASAAIALGASGDHAEPAVDALVEALDGTNPFTAREAAISLGKIGPSAQRAVPPLLRAVQQHPDADVGWFAAESLGRIADPNDASVVAVLEQSAKGSDERMRHSAAAGLRALKSRHAK